MSDESGLFPILKERMLKPGDRLDRVENGVCDGMPDVNGCIEGVEVWMELKRPARPKTAAAAVLANSHPLLISQSNWTRRHRRAGGVVWLLLKCRDWWILIRLSDLEDPMSVNKMCFEELIVASALAFIQDGWDKMRRILSGRTNAQRTARAVRK